MMKSVLILDEFFAMTAKIRTLFLSHIKITNYLTLKHGTFNLRQHRRKFIGLKGFNYDELYSDTLCIVPNEEITNLWQDDYRFMCEHMIYGPVPSFKELIDKLHILNEQIRQLNYQKQLK